MSLLDTFTLNESVKDEEGLIEILWRALNFFPEELWDGINYLGNMSMEHHLKIRTKEELYGAFTVEKLVKKIRELKRRFGTRNLLLALTHDPVILTYYRLEKTGFQRKINLVRDYVTKDVGLVSLFEIDDETGVKVVAHGLGHHHELEHHLNPVDIMYFRLLNGTPLREKGFCRECQDRLEHLVY